MTVIMTRLVLQTFRNYREMFEQQKAVLEQRYRLLLEDSIQDAVFLSTRNNELTDENQRLKQGQFVMNKNLKQSHSVMNQNLKQGQSVMNQNLKQG